MKDIREFLVRKGGKVATAVLIRAFTDVVEAGRSAVFKSLLKELCVLKQERRNGELTGVWVLKDEVRGQD